MPKYITWSYDSRERIEYERRGECNGCGDCCKAMIHMTANNESGDARELGENTDGVGVWSGVYEDDGSKHLYRINNIEVDPPQTSWCSALTGENKCALHHNKAAICAKWPASPEQVALFPNCSFEFDEVDRGEF